MPDRQTEGCWYQANNDFVGDGLSVLQPEDDAATANWAGDWRMPSYEDFVELMDNTTQEWMTFARVSGMKFTSKAEGNSNFIFLPAAGSGTDASLKYHGTNGYYWSATVSPSGSSLARYLSFNSGGAYTTTYYRYHGHSVRPVLKLTVHPSPPRGFRLTITAAHTMRRVPKDP